MDMLKPTLNVETFVSEYNEYHDSWSVVKEMYASTLGSGIWYRKDLPSIIGTQQLEFIYP